MNIEPKRGTIHKLLQITQNWEEFIMNEVVSGAVFIACLGLGFTLGLLLGSIEIGGGIGLGVGLICLLILRKNDKYR